MGAAGCSRYRAWRSRFQCSMWRYEVAAGGLPLLLLFSVAMLPVAILSVAHVPVPLFPLPFIHHNATKTPKVTHTVQCSSNSSSSSKVSNNTTQLQSHPTKKRFYVKIELLPIIYATPINKEIESGEIGHLLSLGALDTLSCSKEFKKMCCIIL